MRAFAFLTLFWIAWAGAARAEPPGAASRYERGVLTLTFENDTFAGTDRYYTSGQRIGWQSFGAPDALAAAGGWLAPWLLPRDAPVAWGVAVSQSIYASRANRVRDPPPDDRPYAGMLTGAFSLHAASEDQLGTLELALGLVGPEAFGEEVQDAIHDLVNDEKLEGWRHQIGNRFVAMLSAERRWRFGRSAGPIEFDVVPALGANLGNAQTSGAASFLLRVGHGLAMDFGPPRIRPALSGLGVFRPPEGLAGYLFVGVEGRAVAYDETLDGNRRGYWDVDRSPLVGELPFGFALAWNRFRLAGTGVFQSETFQEQTRQPHAFGSVNLSFAF